MRVFWRNIISCFDIGPLILRNAGMPTTASDETIRMEKHIIILALFPTPSNDIMPPVAAIRCVPLAIATTRTSAPAQGTHVRLSFWIE